MDTLGKLFGKGCGVPKPKILEAEASTGLKFPETYRDFLIKTDGWTFDEQGVKVMSLQESLEYFAIICNFGITKTWGYFPILENEDSNPWCICCKPPLAGYIVQVNHDDSAQIKFRNIETFFNEIKAADMDEVFFSEDLEGDFQDSERTKQDVEVAQELLINVPNYKGIDRGDACRFAMWLLGDKQVDEIAPFLDDEDPFVARDAAERLNAMRTPKARKILGTAKGKLVAFVEKSLALLKQEGIQASVENESSIRLFPKNILLDMKTFYAMRKNSDAEQAFVQRAKAFIAGH